MKFNKVLLYIALFGLLYFIFSEKKEKFDSVSTNEYKANNLDNNQHIYQPTETFDTNASENLENVMTNNNYQPTETFDTTNTSDNSTNVMPGSSNNYQPESGQMGGQTVGQMGTGQMGGQTVGQMGTGQMGTGQMGTNQMGTSQMGTNQMGTNQMGANNTKYVSMPTSIVSNNAIPLTTTSCPVGMKAHNIKLNYNADNTISYNINCV
jgi:hypothetical protein